MTRFALLPPDLQALERERDALARRVAYLSPNSRRGRMLRQEQRRLTCRLLALEAELVLRRDKDITGPSLDVGHPELFKPIAYWWDQL